MKILYKEYNFHQSSLSKISNINRVVESYKSEGYTLTLRQLYYRLVGLGMIDNEPKAYKTLSTLVSRAREAGLISWMAIEDRHRTVNLWETNEDETEVLNGIEYGYIVDRWSKQENYVEVWVEKDALFNILQRPCIRWMVPYMACKGYLSATHAWRAGRRFEAARERGKNPILLHLGDHDPSGIDMTRDNDDRLWMFSGFDQVEVRRLALNFDQVEEYDPPPNPAKITDSRAYDYISRFGRSSWELDALEPSIIEQLIEDELESLINIDSWQKCQLEENESRKYLSQLYSRWNDIKEFLDK